jgi:hypothetical protein
MDRREFITGSAIGATGLALGAAAPWLSPGAAFADDLFKRNGGKPWKFGVMADTQWNLNLDGQNPGTCAVGIIDLINAQFIAQGVEFVIQVGDLVDQEDNANNAPYGGFAGQRNSPVRAAAAKALYDAGIGFFPLRGNHEGSTTAANEFIGLYPQSRGMGRHVHRAGNFSSPFAALNGLSYSFDFGNVRFVLLDQFARADGSVFNGTTTAYLAPASTGPSTAAVGSNIIDQLPWIDAQLAGRKSDTHAFVLAHKNLIGQNHVDCLFGDNPSTNPAARNAFIHSLQSRGVRYYMGGHDHMHHRSLITSPDGTASVKQMICASDSYKFYYPAKPSNDTTYDSPMREISAAQELDTFGFYIFTVDGPRVTVDFYASGLGLGAYGTPAGNENKLTLSPTNAAFFKQETFGYSLNGREFLVAEGGSYSTVQDSFLGTVAKILGGTNGSVVTDASARPLTKTVNTGWSSPVAKSDAAVASNILSVWGTADSLSLWNESTGVMPAADRTAKGDTYALSINYNSAAVHGIKLNNGSFGIGTRDARGKWVNAVSKNFGGTKKFVYGPWNSGYGLGTYGVDTSTSTAWAVVNYDGDFAAAAGL